MDEQARKWQDRLDTDFPHGLVATWEDGNQAHSYHIPRPEVVSMQGLDPVVFMRIPGWDKAMAGTVSSYEVLQHSPHLLARVAFSDHEGRKMLWSAGLGKREVEGMAADRRESLQASDEGTLYKGDAWQ